MQTNLLFPLGKTVGTPKALEHLARHGVTPQELLMRHQSGDWGVVSDDDQKENKLSLREGFRILSAYQVGTEKVWVITEADRSSTCILLPDEY